MAISVAGRQRRLSPASAAAIAAAAAAAVATAAAASVEVAELRSCATTAEPVEALGSLRLTGVWLESEEV